MNSCSCMNCTDFTGSTETHNLCCFPGVTNSPDGRESEDRKVGWGSEAVGPKEALGSDPNVSSNSLRCYLVTSVLWAPQPSYRIWKIFTHEQCYVWISNIQYWAGATTKVQVLHFKLCNSNNTHGEEGWPYFWLVCNWKHQPRPWNDAIQGVRVWRSKAENGLVIGWECQAGLAPKVWMEQRVNALWKIPQDRTPRHQNKDKR